MEVTRIAFTGDIAFSRYYKDRYNDPIVAKPLIRFLNDSDYTVLNVEGAVAAPDHSGMFVHTNDPKAVKVFQKLGGNIWNLANNHTMDAGPAGMAETLKYAREAGARTVGAGMNREEATTPVIIPSSGGIGIFSAVYEKKNTPATKKKAGALLETDTAAIRRIVREIKKQCRWCVMVLHSGSEFLNIPMPNYRDRFLSFLDMGVDVIVGHHPHIPENYEYVGKKIIFYSLGNFIFDTDYQRVQSHTDEGVLVKLSFTEDAVSFESVGTKIDRTTGLILKGPLPAVFVPLNEEDYTYLRPLAAVRYLEHDQKRAGYSQADEVNGLDKAGWEERWKKEAEKERPVIKCCLEERAKYNPKRRDPKYKTLEDYFI